MIKQEKNFHCRLQRLFNDIVYLKRDAIPERGFYYGKSNTRRRISLERPQSVHF